MSSWRNIELGKAIQFNPPERIAKGEIAKKIAMEKLTPFEKKIRGFEMAEYSAGPKFRNGDTLVAKITPCLENGKTAQVDILDDGEVAFGSSEFIVLRSNGNSIQDYIFYLAKSPAFRKKAISCMEGTSGRKRVNEGALKLQVLPIPDTKTQQKIASVLSSFDSKIELNNRINRELEQMAKLLYDYWFVQFEFPCPELVEGSGYKSSGGKMVWNEELKREIPVGWKLHKIGKLLYTSLGGTPSTAVKEYWENGVVNWLNSGEIANFPIITSELKVSEAALKNSAAELLPKGSVLLSITRHLRPSILGIDACANQSVVGIKEKGDIKSYFLYPYLKNEIARLNVMRTGAQQPHINKEIVDESLILIPNENSNLLNEYNLKVGPFYERIINNALQNQQLASLRDWLLPMLMNGQVTVGAKEKVSYEVTEGMDVAAEPRGCWKKLNAK